MKRYGDFITSDEDLALLTSIRKYIDKEVMPIRLQLDEDYAAFEKAYEGLVKFRVQKRGFSPEYGGLGIRSATTICAITEEISPGRQRAVPSRPHYPLVPGCRQWVPGNKPLMDKFIPMFCGDTPRCGCLAITGTGRRLQY